MLTLYGIPNCGTVKKAKKWLDDRDVPYEWVDFRKQPVSSERVAAWVDSLGSRPLRNTSGGSYRALPDDRTSWDDDTWASKFAADPMLLKRPVIERDGVAIQAGFRGTDAELESRLA